MHMRYRARFFLYYSIVITIIYAFLLSFINSYISREMENRTVDNIQQLKNNMAEQLNLYLKDMDNFAQHTVINANIHEIFSSIENISAESNYFTTNLDANRSVTKTLLEIVGPSYSPARVSLYNNRGDYISVGKLDTRQDAVTETITDSSFRMLYTKLEKLSNKNFVLPPHPDFWYKHDKKLISLFRLLRSTQNPPTVLGVVEVQQPVDILDKIFLGTEEDLDFYIAADDGTTIYPLPESLTAEAQARIAACQEYFSSQGSSDEGNKLVKIRGEKIILAWQSIKSFGWRLVLTQSQKKLFQPVSVVSNVIIAVAIMIYISTLILFFILSNHLAKPLIQLVASVRNVSLNHMALEIQNKDNMDELSELNAAFRNMFDMLKRSMNENIQLHEHEMHAHLLALQSQIDPHFLYNMLAIISAMAYENEVPSISTVCRNLSEMLRYSTSFEENEILLGQELRHADIYLKLMKTRYEDRFQYSFQIENGLEMLKVPKLILQPLLENCFVHAFKNVNPPWQINLSVSSANGMWMIRVKDNGIGFDQSSLGILQQRIKDFIDNPSKHISEIKPGGLGLFNTVLRLKIMYKDSAIFDVSENSLQGTIITIGGPIK